MFTDTNQLASTSQSLVALLERCSEGRPDTIGYTFVGRSDTETGLSFAELKRRALAISGQIVENHGHVGRLVIGYPSGQSYLEAVFGCLYAGVTPVSGHVTEFVRLRASTEGLLRTARATNADGVLTSPGMVELGSGMVPDLDWISVDGQAEMRSSQAETEAPEITYVQTTSGSTGTQRGVALSAANLIANLEAQAALFPIAAKTVIVSWLPMSHDMGFVGPLLQPLHAGAHTVFLSPFQFVVEPARWLRAISRHRAAVSGCPNFGYELALRRVSFAQRAELDLSSWICALNGAEPVRPDTLARFSRAMAPAGFDSAAFVAGYGLAEATSVVTASARGRGPTVRAFDRTKLAEGWAVVASDEREGRRLVGHGVAAPEHEVLIVDICTRKCVPDGQVGEIWVSGPGTSAGYVGSDSKNHEVFAATLADGGGPYLRTGDMGFVFDGELHISGRSKDFILLRGVNHAPQDLEATVLDAHEATRDRLAVVAAMPGEHEDGVLVAVELDEEDLAEERLDAMSHQIRVAVGETHGVGVTDVALLSAGGIPVTDSGKVRRSETVRLYLSGELPGTIRVNEYSHTS